MKAMMGLIRYIDGFFTPSKDLIQHLEWIFDFKASFWSILVHHMANLLKNLFFTKIVFNMFEF